jgi:hypothetical protein
MKKVALLLVLMLIPFAASAYEFCSSGEDGIGLEIISVEDTLKDNSDAWIWDWNDDVEIDIEVKNNLNQEGDFTVELIFIDNNDNEVYVAVDNGDLERSLTLGSDENETISFNFKVEYGVVENAYDIYIKFYEDGKQDSECEEDSQEVTIGSMIFCENGKSDESDLEIKGVSDNNKDNDNDWDWSVGDDIQIEVEVDNKDYDDMYFNVELVFVDEGGAEVSFATSSGNLAQSVEIERGSSEDVVFNFTVDNEVDSETYGFYVVAISDENSDICTSVRAYGGSVIEVKVSGDYGILVSSVNGSNSVDAGSTENYSVVVRNLGTSKEDRILAVAYNFNLGVREEYVISDLAAGASKTVVFEIDFPIGSAGTSERIAFFADYNYDEDKDYYLNSSSDGGFDKNYLVAIGAVPTIQLINNSSDDFNVSSDSVGSNESGADGLSGSEDKFPFWIFFTIVFIIVVILVVVIYLFMKRKASSNYYPSVNSARY